MAFEPENELLQDFLIEAGELLDALDSQLVGLEQAPSDKNLLNAIFRAFHTIKGGAGFLEVGALVEVCHRAEDTFNLLRNGELTVTPALMDVMLRVLDALNSMFASLRSGLLPPSVGSDFLKEIEALARSQSVVQPPVVVAPAAPELIPPVVDNATASLVDDEFEKMLSDLDAAERAQAPAETAPVDPSSDLITDEEFESLLDQLHGKGSFKPQIVAAEPTPASVIPADIAQGSDDITDDEFERVLDALYGKGQGPTVAPPTQTQKSEEPPAAVKPVVSKPVASHQAVPPRNGKTQNSCG